MEVPRPVSHRRERVGEGSEPGDEDVDHPTLPLDLAAGDERRAVPGDAPVLLVNDRQMVSTMSDARLDELVDTPKASAK